MRRRFRGRLGVDVNITYVFLGPSFINLDADIFVTMPSSMIAEPHGRLTSEGAHLAPESLVTVVGD